jgi:polyhydroxybutyrate depolymerase
MRRGWLVLLVVVTSGLAVHSAEEKRTVQVGGRARSYLLHLPASFDPKREYPVVVAFHGGASNAEAMVRFSGLSEKADQAGFIAVYPSGSGRLSRALTWNAGRCCGYASAKGIDDVAFTRALVDDLGRLARVDRRRVYATGISNGGMMAYRVAAELPDLIAAVASVSGTLEVAVPAGRRPLPVLHFHGTDDKFVPFEGGRGPRSLATGPHASVEHTIRTWTTLDGCRPEPRREELPLVVTDGTNVVRESYPGCRDGSEVVLYEIRGGGHTWPGRQPRPAVGTMLGRTSGNVSANDVMWEFFRRHPVR